LESIRGCCARGRWGGGGAAATGWRVGGFLVVSTSLGGRAAVLVCPLPGGGRLVGRPRQRRDLVCRPGGADRGRVHASALPGLPLKIRRRHSGGVFEVGEAGHTYV
ncbi:unnamed protein product, partial [Ectocarpus fasciculatus]